MGKEAPLRELGFYSRQETVMKIKPLGDRVVVRRMEALEKTSGGILLPDAAKEKPQKGTVLAVGPGRMLKDGTRRPLQVKEGDVILFTAWAGDEFRESRTENNILVMHEEDILAVLD
jgi:chaperonin GroES